MVRRKLKETPEGVVYPVVCLSFIRLHPNALVPEKKTEGSIGLDLGCVERMEIFPAKTQQKAYKVHTGVACEIPEGYYATLHLRSSVGLNSKLRLANQTGIIDSDYTGEVILLVENTGAFVETIEPGERIAQLVLHKGVPVTTSEVKEIKKTKRGSKGFGSTGK